MSTPEYSLSFPPTAEEYRDNIRKQKAWAKEIADKLRQGVPLEEWEAAFTAEWMLARADEVSEVLPKGKQRPPKINHSAVARDYVLLRQQGFSKTAAKSKLAENYGVETDAISYAIEQKGADAAHFYGPEK